MTKDQLQKLLDRVGLSQSEAARQIGLDPRSMRRYLSGETEIPRTVEILLMLITDPDTGKIRASNLRLRSILGAVESDLRKIAGGATDAANVARKAANKIVTALGEPWPE